MCSFVYIQVLRSLGIAKSSSVRQSMAKLTYIAWFWASYLLFFFFFGQKNTEPSGRKSWLSIAAFEEDRWGFSGDGFLAVCQKTIHLAYFEWIYQGFGSGFQPQWFKCQSCQWPELIKFRRLTDNTKTHQSLNYAPKCQVINLKWQEDQNRRISLPGHPSF